MRRLPITNWVLIGVTVIVSMLAPAFSDSVERLLLWREGFSIQQLLSYQFLHGGLLHLLANMTFLFCFGNAINAKLGHWQFLCAYLFLGMVAGGAWLMLGRGPALLGASGAIAGITGVFLMLYPRNDLQVFYWVIYQFGTFTMPSGWLILLYMSYDLIGTVFLSNDAIAYVCHLGGEIVGIGLATALLGMKLVKSSVGEENLLQVLGLQKRIKRHQLLDSYGRRIGREKVESD
jgi:membrane associated rhomboid family serine protease